MVGFLTAAILDAVVTTYSMVNMGKKGKRKAAPSHTKKGIPSAGTPNKFVVMHHIDRVLEYEERQPKGKKNKKGELVIPPTKHYYLVSWVGYDDKYNSWEPKENLNKEGTVQMPLLPCMLYYLSFFPPLPQLLFFAFF